MCQSLLLVGPLGFEKGKVGLKIDFCILYNQFHNFIIEFNTTKWHESYRFSDSVSREEENEMGFTLFCSYDHRH